MWATDFSPVQLLSESATVAATDLSEVESTEVSGDFTATARRDGTVHGIACWFRAQLTPQIDLETTPGVVGTSWAHVFLPLEEPLAAGEGDELTAELEITDNGKVWAWRVTPSGAPPGQRHATDAPW